MTDDLVRRANYALNDMQGRVEAGKLAVFEECIARIEELEVALRPFTRYVDKSTCEITMVWADGGYESTYTDTLKPADFENAHDAYWRTL
jgi:hypothetical protein